MAKGTAAAGNRRRFDRHQRRECEGVFADFAVPDMTVFNGAVPFEGDDASGDLGLWVTNAQTK